LKSGEAIANEFAELDAAHEVAARRVETNLSLPIGEPFGRQIPKQLLNRIGHDLAFGEHPFTSVAVSTIAHELEFHGFGEDSRCHKYDCRECR
jgi:hypothetical protein